MRALVRDDFSQPFTLFGDNRRMKPDPDYLKHLLAAFAYPAWNRQGLLVCTTLRSFAGIPGLRVET
jgi:hypothetical protein